MRASPTIFAYGDAHRYRLGINHTRLPVNQAKGVPGSARNYGRDGAMRFDDNGGRARNYEPNSYDGPAETGERYDFGYAIEGAIGPTAPVRHAEDSDFVQAGMLYRVMKEDERIRLVENIGASLAQVTRPDVIERALAHFQRAHAEYGRRVAERVKVRR